LGPRVVAESGLLGVIMRCLASEDEGLRGLAYQGLAVFENLLSEIDFRCADRLFACGGFAEVATGSSAAAPAL
jgi:hypothetical protein